MIPHPPLSLQRARRPDSRLTFANTTQAIGVQRFFLRLADVPWIIAPFTHYEIYKTIKETSAVALLAGNVAYGGILIAS
jgi:hypothetical protein